MSGGRSPQRARSQTAHARTALAWGLALFAAAQLVLVLSLEWWTPGVRELQYGVKQDLLRRQLARAPGRPLVLFMGTSRTLNGLDPAELPALPSADGQPSLVFNFAHAGSGSLRQLLLLRRLLREGIRPVHIFLELLPATLANDAEAESLIDQKLVGWRDWSVMSRYWPRSRSRVAWCGNNLVPCAALHYQFLGRLVPQLLSWERQPDWPSWSLVNDWGFLRNKRTAVSDEEYRRAVEHARREYAPALGEFHISPSEDRALREFLSLCRQKGIEVTLYLMPEGSPFRGWYTAATEKTVQTYLARLGEEYHLAVIDARCWVSDTGFVDGHHLLPGAAAAFSRHFGHAVYQPFLAGK